MAKFIILAFFAFALKSTFGDEGHCEIDGIDYMDWIIGYYPPEAINDTHSGEILRFQSRNIAEFLGSEGKYLSADFINNEIIVYTTSNFTYLEEEDIYGNIVDIELNFKCNDSTTDSISIYQTVHDVNNHQPIFNQSVYEYHFGMTIPKDFELTQFLEINATDGDFSNSQIYFSTDFNEEFKVEYAGQRTGDVFATTIKALKNINGPYRREFILNATDDGNPPTNSSVMVIITVNDFSKCNATHDKSMASARNLNIFLAIFYVLYEIVMLAKSV